MKKGIIIYQKEDALANSFFIERCLLELNEDKYFLEFVEEQNVDDYIVSTHIDYAIYRGRDYSVINKLNEQNIIVFNNAKTNQIANNKYLTIQLLKALNLPFIDTFLNEQSLSFPYIMKSVSGHGGKEVYLIDEQDKKDKIIVKYPLKQFIYQPFIINEGDARIYLVNKKFIACVLRRSKTDHRSNYSLGGQISLYQPKEEIIKEAERIACYLNADYLGVDFLLTKDGYVFNEIEDPVGARMLYKLSEIDIVSLFINYIKKRLE